MRLSRGSFFFCVIQQSNMPSLLVAYLIVAVIHFILVRLSHAREGFEQTATAPSADVPAREPNWEKVESKLEKNVRDMYAFVYSDADAVSSLDKFFDVASLDPAAAPAKTSSAWPPALANDDARRIEEIYEARKLRPKPDRKDPAAGGGGGAAHSHMYEVVGEYDEPSTAGGGIGGFDGASIAFAGV